MRYISEEALNAKRPIPFYFITTHDPEELTYEKFYEDLSDMKKKGYGGIVLFNRPPEGFTRDIYFEEGWFEMVGNCVRACNDLNMRVWLNDDIQAPPGDIGGRLQKIAPHLQPLQLKLKDGNVRVVEASWGFPAFEEKESAELFQKYVYEEYKKRFGEYFGNCIVGFFSDADNRRVNSDVFCENSLMKNHFPWSVNFSESFLKKYGYDICPYLASILQREPSEQAHDYWEHCGNLYMSWFASNYRWCRENGLEYTFHSGATTPFSIETTEFNSVYTEGKAIDAGTLCDWPGTDHECLDINGGRLMLRERFHMPVVVWGGDEKLRRPENFYDTYADLRAKQTQSGAYLHDKKGVMCEMFAAVNWNVSYKDLRNIASYQMMQGVNFIVYHAYHYRLHGETKFFAPHAFSPHSHTDFAIKEFNDSVALNAYICSQGKLKVDIALLDSTDYIWKGIADSTRELELAKELNHYPGGYIISDIKGLHLKASELKAVVNPGLPLSAEEREEILSLGLKIYEQDEVDRIQYEIPTGIQWNGNRELMFMRRVLDDGSELLIVGNIESDDPAVGTLTINGCDYRIEVASGELAFFGGGYDSYHIPVCDEEKLMLSPCVKVHYDKANMIPLMRWEDDKGRGFSLIKPENRIFFILSAEWIKAPFEADNEPPSKEPVFPFSLSESMEGLEVLMSERFLKNVAEIYLDEKQLAFTEKTRIFDDTYCVFRFRADKGLHRIGLKLISDVETGDLVYLRGNFDVDLHTSGKLSYYGGVFNMQTYIPEKAVVSLSQRRTELRTDQSWTEQGQPFYSGSIDYMFDVDIPEKFERSVLVLPDVGAAVKVYVDGDYIDTAIYPPFRIPLDFKAGKHTITLRIANTLGNMFEGFRMPSGLMQTPYITGR